MKRLLFSLVLGLTVPAVTRADVENLGILSYDVLIPSAPGFPGVDAFDISNLTGDPSAGGYALPPGFPSFTGVTFQNSSLTLVEGGSQQVIPLGDIGPGFFSLPALEFSDTSAFSSATFTATLDQTDLTLFDGTIFTATSPAVSVELAPSAGSSLVAGTDYAVISVSNVPEPTSWLLLMTVLASVVRPKRVPGS